MSNQDFMAPINVKSAVQIVVDRLTQGIIDGQLRPGEKIPTEPELAASFGVGRNTVREAVRILIAYGVLEIRRPDGTFVCESFQPQGINPLLYSLILTKEDSYRELIGLRKSVETGIMVVLMEQGISEAQLERLKQLAAEIERTVKAVPYSIDAIAQSDINFHQEIAAATGNRLIVSLNEMLTKLTLGSRLETIRQVMAGDDKEYLIFTHYDLLAKITGSDFHALCESIQNSYFYWKDVNKSMH